MSSARGAGSRACRWAGLLDRLQRLDDWGFFLDPVDPAAVPDYADIVRTPMHFELMQSKLATGAYGGPASAGDAEGAAGLAALEADFRLIAANAMLYNKPDTPYYAAAQKLLAVGEQRIENARARLGACVCVCAEARAAAAARRRKARGRGMPPPPPSLSCPHYPSFLSFSASSRRRR